MWFNVNPGLINPKRLVNWGGTIKKYWMKWLLEEYPLINKPWFNLWIPCFGPWSGNGCDDLQCFQGSGNTKPGFRLIPRRIKVGYNPNYKWINPTKIPFITGVISHLLTGMSHQVGFNGIYPLVNIQKTMENHHAINGKIHYKWPFSIAMLNYQRVDVFFWLLVFVSVLCD